MAEIASAFVSLVPSAKGFGKATSMAIDGDMQAAGKSGGHRFSGAFGKVAKGGAVAVGALFATSLTKGFGRLAAIEDAEAKLGGLGFTGKATAAIMKNVTAAVRGTAFGLDEAGSAAAGAIASGIKPGKDLTRFLTLTGDAATQAGVEFNSMAQMMNKVQGQGKLTGDVVAQMAENGLYVMPLLAKSFGVSQEAMTKMVSAGKIDAATFQKVLTNSIGGSAQKSGKTTSGALKNMGAAFGRFGAAVLSGVFPLLAPLFGKVSKALDGLSAAVPKVSAAFKSMTGFVKDNQTTFKILAGVITALLVPALILAGTQATISAAKQVAAWVTTKAKAASSIAFQVAGNTLIALGWGIVGAKALLGAAKVAAAWILSKAQIAGTLALAAVAYTATIAGWTAMGIQSLLGAAKVAAAWLIAMGPIGLVIATIAGLVFLIVKNWDTIKAKTAAVWSAITGGISSAVSTVVNFVKANWPLLLAILTGPIGLATLFIVKNWAKLKASTSAAFNAVRAVVSGVMNSVRSTVSSAIGNVVKLFSGLLGRIRGTLSGAGSALVSIGKNIVQGLISGIKSMGGAIGRALVALLPGPLKKFAGKLGIASPSKVFREFGNNIGQGLVLGVDDEQNAVSRASLRLVDSLSSPKPVRLETTSSNANIASTHPLASAGTTDIERLIAAVEAGHVLRVGGRDFALAVVDANKKLARLA